MNTNTPETPPLAPREAAREYLLKVKAIEPNASPALLDLAEKSFLSGCAYLHTAIARTLNECRPAEFPIVMQRIKDDLDAYLKWHAKQRAAKLNNN